MRIRNQTARKRLEDLRNGKQPPERDEDSRNTKQTEGLEDLETGSKPLERD